MSETVEGQTPSVKPYHVYFHSKTVGEIEFRDFSFAYYSQSNKILKEPITDIEFAYKLAYLLILNSNVSFDDFSLLPQNEIIAIIRQISEKNRNIQKYFGVPLDEFVFKEFKESIKKYNQEKRSELLSTISKSVNSKGLIPQEVLDNVFIPQIIFYTSWFESNQQIFENFQKALISSQKSLEKFKINVEILNEILRQYYWFYSFCLPEECYIDIIEIHNSGVDIQKRIDQVYINYFSNDNFSILEEMVKGWSSNTIFHPRMEILLDCVQTLKFIRPGYNPSNIVLPALIAQIDGVLLDIIKNHGFQFNIEKKCWETLSGEKIQWVEAYKSIETNLEFISVHSNYLILDVLFQKAYHGDQLIILPTFSRHKIEHGESLDYGKIENVIRAFLILDFLSYIE